MIFKKLLLQTVDAILMITLVGCNQPVTLLESPVPTQPLAVSPSPTEMQATKINSTPTLKPISTFEECIAFGNSIDGNTYPRQCISNTGESFFESLPEGIILSKVYGDQSQTEKPAFIIPTKDGGYLITGTANTYQCLLRKLDSSGEIEWEQTLGLELREQFQFPNSWFNCSKARQTPNGGYAIMSTGSDFERVPPIGRFFILKFDQNGNQTAGEEFIWKAGRTALLDTEGNLVWYSVFGLAGTLIETSDDGYAVVGKFSYDPPDSRTHIFKADANRDYVWEKNLCSDKYVQDAGVEEILCSDNNLWGDAIQSRDGGYVFTGTYGKGIWLVKTDANGNVEWIKSYMQEAGKAMSHALIQTSDDGFLIAGENNGDGALIKTDSTGNLEWTKTFGGNQYDTFREMIQGLNGQVIIMGWTKAFGEEAENIWLLAIDLSTLK